MSEGERELPLGWADANFSDVCFTLSDNGKKLKQKQYLPAGKYPVIDQGDSSIAGYTDDKALVFEGQFPIIAFGDHTRRFKKISQKFVVGADGVKLFKPSSHLDFDYILHLLRISKFEDRGYSRHFQFVKKLTLPIAPLAEQRRIVDKIDELFSSIEAGERAIARASEGITRYRKAVLKAAVTGELTADWRAENPPQALPDEVGTGSPSGKAVTINETAEALLSRILKARYAAWEKAELEKLDAKGKARPKTDKEWAKFRGRYKEPAGPNPDFLIQLPEIPYSWLWSSLDSLILGIDAGKSFKCDERPPKNGETGLVKVSAVSWGEFNEEESKTITDPNRVDLRYEINTGDLLISRANTVELVGASVIAGVFTRHLLLSDKILRIRLVEDMRHWINQLFLSNLGRIQIEARSSGNQMSMRNISQDGLKKLAVPLPPLEEQTEIVSRVEKALSKADKVEATLDAQARQAKALKQAVLKTAFEGRLVPQDPNDEPASELLKRIKEER